MDQDEKVIEGEEVTPDTDITGAEEIEGDTQLDVSVEGADQAAMLLSLEELIKNHIRPRIPCPEMDQIEEQLENLLKDRQVLSAHGVSAYQDCKSIATDIQGALRTLQSNAAANATKKRT